MTYLLIAGFSCAFFLLGYGVRALLSRKRRRQWMKRRSGYRLFSRIRPATDERILNDAIDAFTKAKEDGRLDRSFALLGQTSAYLALGDDEHAEAAFVSALASGRAAPPPVERHSGLDIGRAASELERCFTNGLAKARRAQALKKSNDNG